MLPVSVFRNIFLIITKSESLAIVFHFLLLGIFFFFLVLCTHWDYPILCVFTGTGRVYNLSNVPKIAVQNSLLLIVWGRARTISDFIFPSLSILWITQKLRAIISTGTQTTLKTEVLPLISLPKKRPCIAICVPFVEIPFSYYPYEHTVVKGKSPHQVHKWKHKRDFSHPPALSELAKTRWLGSHFTATLFTYGFQWDSD